MLGLVRPSASSKTNTVNSHKLEILRTKDFIRIISSWNYREVDKNI